MSEASQTVEVEVLLSVHDYIGRIRSDSTGGIPGAALAFRRAAEDAEGAMMAAREHLFHELSADDAIRVNVLSASYLETDSSNPTHACAHYRVELDVPTSLTERVTAAFMGDGGFPSP